MDEIIQTQAALKFNFLSNPVRFFPYSLDERLENELFLWNDSVTGHQIPVYGYELKSCQCARREGESEAPAWPTNMDIFLFLDA